MTQKLNLIAFSDRGEVQGAWIVQFFIVGGGRHLSHMQEEWVGLAYCLSGHVQPYHKVSSIVIK